MATVPNILADRYASAEMRELWTAKARVRAERELWIALLKGQRDLGLAVAQGAIEAYEKAIDAIDLEDIRRREAISRHDVKARIESFNAVAGYEEIHKGMTSRDLTENVEQLLVRKSLKVVLTHAVAALRLMARRARAYRELVISARTHNVAAQPTTLGKRIAMYAEELAVNIEAANYFQESHAARGIKGAVGTQLDQLTLFDGNEEKVEALEARVMEHLGFAKVATSVGQVYPRSQDATLISHLLGLAAGPANFARSLRLMAGHEVAGEGFAKGQVGSSAMPHKMNSRSCERINGFLVLLRGYQTMASGLAGDQWHEGDVSCSVVRRVMLPDAFFAIDGLFETFLTVLDSFVVHEGVVEQENQRYLPFLATTTIMMEAVKGGVGRETAHEVIKEHAVAVAKDLRAGIQGRNDLIDRLAKDARLGLSAEHLHAILGRVEELCGSAAKQVEKVWERAELLLAAFPEAEAYSPGEIL
ncbi:MAG: adenylosuccinate lyase [Puniceicoccaceae bacterium]